MSGLRERVDPLCVRHGDNPTDGVCTCEAADTPADTTLRDQIAQYARDQTTLKILDALLPLLRAHDAQVRRDALNQAADAWDELRGKWTHYSTADGGWQADYDGTANWLRDRAASPQPARDQAHDET